MVETKPTFGEVMATIDFNILNGETGQMEERSETRYFKSVPRKGGKIDFEKIKKSVIRGAENRQTNIDSFSVKSVQFAARNDKNKFEFVEVT